MLEEVVAQPHYTHIYTRGDEIHGKVPASLYSLFKRDKILTYNRAIHMWDIPK